MGQHLALTADIIIGSATLDSDTPGTMVSVADPAGRKRTRVPAE
jgi:hypothetical protein